MTLIRKDIRRKPASTMGQFFAVKSPKAKVCTVCKGEYFGGMPLSKVCGLDCAKSLAVSIRGKLAKVAAIKERKEAKAALEKLKTRGEWLKEAKVAIQRYRRLEELALGSGCISCGRSQQEVEGTDAWKPGGAWDGGHFLSKGARPELALEPLNIWLQCKSCNAGSSKYARKGYTVNASFRQNLIDRIGPDAVEALEADHAPKHYTVDDLIAIKATYTVKARALLKGQL